MAEQFDPLSAPPPFSLGNKIFRAIWTLAWLLLARWTPPPLHAWRRLVLRAFGAQIGSNARIYASVAVWNPRNLISGEGAIIGPGVRLYNQGCIRIGDRCVVSQRAHLCASTHRASDPSFTLVTRPITLASGCWVAAEAFVGPGVTMGEHSVLGARAALFDDAEPDGIYRGNPAARIGKRQLAKRCGNSTGREDRIRTCDPHTPSVMRYQAALLPVSSGGGAL